MRVLLVEDDPRIANFVAKGLREQAYAVDLAASGEDALYQASINIYDLAILDVMIPAPDGFEVCRRLRQSGLRFPILMLTARDATDDRVQGLDTGADDYLTKPFEFEELLARLRALVRRGHQVKDPVLRVHDLEIDTAAHAVRRAGRSIALTPREYSLLEFLAFHPGQVVSRSMIWEHLYDEHDDNTSNVVDVYIRYLRNKIDKGFDPPLILTRWGEGYMLRGEGT